VGHRRLHKNKGLYFYCGKGNENNQPGTGFFVYPRIVPAVKGVEFVSDRMSYIVLRGRLPNIVVLNAHAPTETKSDDWRQGMLAIILFTVFSFLVY
jgi:hypothetical protein